MISKENLIKFSCDQYPEDCNPKILKVINNPKLDDGHVFIELNKSGMTVLAHSHKVDQARLQIFTGFMASVIKKFNLNLAFRFILNTYDEPATGDFPVFSFCGNEKYQSNIVVPDPHLLSRHMGKTYTDNKDFKTKNSSIIFRGSDTGNFPIASKNERILACWETKDKPSIDFKITNFVSYSKQCLDMFGFDIDKISANHLTLQDQCQHKYIADINGNTMGWDRSCWALGTNSVLVKIQLTNISDETWYSKYMELNHIVPRLLIKEIENFNSIEAEYNINQQIFNKILLDPATQEEYLKNILIKYESQYNN